MGRPRRAGRTPNEPPIDVDRPAPRGRRRRRGAGHWSGLGRRAGAAVAHGGGTQQHPHRDVHGVGRATNPGRPGRVLRHARLQRRPPGRQRAARRAAAADVSALTQAVVTAQAAYDNAVRTLAAIKHPTPQNIAAARAQVRSAEASLLQAQIAAKGSTTSQLEAAQAQVAQAQAALAAAKASANGPSATQLAQARAQLAQAQAALVSAQNAAAGPSTAQRTQAEAAVSHAQINLDSDNQALNAAREAALTCQDAAACAAAQQAVKQAEARVASDQVDLTAAQAQLAALTSPSSQSEAQAALASAQAQVATAQAALDALTGPDATASAQAQLAAAESAARSAQASLDELTAPDAKAQRQAQVSAARAGLTSAQASLAAILNPTPAALAEARSNAAVAKASLDAAKAKLDQLRGTVTWLPDEGATIERGDPMYELDGQPSGILLYGTRPAWRSMAEGATGEDVRQLQENLIALGFTADGLSANGTFDAATTAAVKAWQHSLGRAETGRVDLGEVVFQPGAVRVASHTVTVGDTVTAGTQVLGATSTERVVTIALEADQQALVSAGDEVDVDLPDGTTVTGHVDTVGTVATAADAQSAPTIEVTIVLDDPAASGTIDQAPVDVLITTISRENVLAVPVNALLALLEGGYAVEVAAADGTTHLVGVETGHLPGRLGRGRADERRPRPRATRSWCRRERRRRAPRGRPSATRASPPVEALARASTCASSAAS